MFDVTGGKTGLAVLPTSPASPTKASRSKTPTLSIFSRSPVSSGGAGSSRRTSSPSASRYGTLPPPARCLWIASLDLPHIGAFEVSHSHCFLERLFWCTFWFLTTFLLHAQRVLLVFSVRHIIIKILILVEFGLCHKTSEVLFQEQCTASSAADLMETALTTHSSNRRRNSCRKHSIVTTTIITSPKAGTRVIFPLRVAG